MQTDTGDVSMQTDKTGEESEEEEEEEEDEDEAEEEVMLPMADMLNAAYERDNVSCLEGSLSRPL
jgi:hypothetical protein